ncbi:hypothetical protein D3C72_2009610 [compost metagenome]
MVLPFRTEGQHFRQVGIHREQVEKLVEAVRDHMGHVVLLRHRRRAFLPGIAHSDQNRDKHLMEH